jgi:hypothetical protein
MGPSLLQIRCAKFVEQVKCSFYIICSSIWVLFTKKDMCERIERKKTCAKEWNLRPQWSLPNCFPGRHGPHDVKMWLVYISPFQFSGMLIQKFGKFCWLDAMIYLECCSKIFLTFNILYTCCGVQVSKKLKMFYYILYIKWISVCI